MLTQERLKALLCYNPATGVFIWRKTINHRAVADTVAGDYRKDGYGRISIDNHRYYQHRLAWLYIYGVWPSKLLDHVDRNPRNNCLANLRDVSQSQNMLNQVAAHARNKSTGVLGVYAWGKRYVTRITVKGVYKHIGVFDTIEEASAAYQKTKTVYIEETN